MKKLILILFIIFAQIICIGCNSNPRRISEEANTALPLEEPSEDFQEKEENSEAPAESQSQEPENTEITEEPDKAKEILETMSLEEKVGQLFFVRHKKETALNDLKTYHLGGIILFGVDFENETAESIKNKISEYQNNSPIPLLIGVDEEGGDVNRVSKYPAFRSAPFKSSQSLYNEGGYELIEKDTTEKSQFLKNLGINVNLAPVCDVSTDPNNFIYRRSFGKGAEETSEYVKTVVSAMTQEKIGATLKHFPGYGNNIDTHTEIAIDERDYTQFENNDFLPFKAGITAGAGSILVSHNIVTAIDKDYPASLSERAHEILRNELNFNGVIMTDDLAMEAIKKYTGNEEAAVKAILAGNDLIIATDYETQIPAVINAVKDGTVDEEIINQAAIRVLNWKMDLNLFAES
ncbi:MAG: beta-hexosaminidase [Lachnospiraceae bacterium]|nr:beta-hexosaminidase [Lachnospiraceae bacterium]